MEGKRFFSSNVPQYILAGLLCLLIVSCASVHIQKDAAESLEFTVPEGGNTLISFETRITLPGDWRFFISEDDGALVRFTDSSKDIHGYLEWCETGFSLSDNEMISFLEGDLLGEYTILRIIPAGDVPNISHLVEFTSPDESVSFSLAVLPQDLGFYLLELSSEVIESAGLSEFCAGIASGIRNEPEGYCMRNLPGTVQIHDISGMWNWAGDISGGTVLYRYFVGYRLCSAAVVETDEASLESYLENGGYNFFEEDVIVNNQIRTLAAAGRDLPEGPEVHVFIDGRKNYIVSFSLEDEDEKFESKTLLLTEEIQTFFRSAVTFGGL